mmetsp:Transcript_4197/g.12027  ORF Transcript_4197/g.12027 Transcript_4197/m.12027 type:complete len:253 (-) Transcript_4197:372-1130(-)
MAAILTAIANCGGACILLSPRRKQQNWSIDSSRAANVIIRGRTETIRPRHTTSTRSRIRRRSHKTRLDTTPRNTAATSIAFHPLHQSIHTLNPSTPDIVSPPCQKNQSQSIPGTMGVLSSPAAKKKQSSFSTSTSASSSLSESVSESVHTATTTWTETMHSLSTVESVGSCCCESSSTVSASSLLGSYDSHSTALSLSALTLASKLSNSETKSKSESKAKSKSKSKSVNAVSNPTSLGRLPLRAFFSAMRCN